MSTERPEEAGRNPPAHGPTLSDAECLERFIRGRDQDAFAALVARHGPLVYGVCRRVLGNSHDADDAFQSTFLVLTKKAGSIIRRGMPANWLYQVAYRTALNAKTTIAKRQRREKPMEATPEPVAAAEPAWAGLAPLLDKELSALPHKYQLAVVLCDLEGKSGRDAAEQLGWPAGTFFTRLRKGRALLAGRLARRGIALSAGALAVALAENAAAAAVPAALVGSTVQAASTAATAATGTAALVAKPLAGVKLLVKSAWFTKAALATGVVAAVAGGASVVPRLIHRPEPKLMLYNGPVRGNFNLALNGQDGVRIHIGSMAGTDAKTQTLIVAPAEASFGAVTAGTEAPDAGADLVISGVESKPGQATLGVTGIALTPAPASTALAPPRSGWMRWFLWFNFGLVAVVCAWLAVRQIRAARSA